MSHIYFIGGGKGGVGKSIVTSAFLDLFIRQKKNLFFVDTDTSNPDVYKMYSSEAEGTHLNLDDADGWINLINLCDEKKDSIFVINSAARNMEGIAKYSGILTGSLAELQRKLITIWVINRQRDSLELLKSYSGLVADSKIHVIRNGYFGNEAKFQLYNSSNLRQEIEAKGGLSVTFPDLADRVCDDIYSNRMSIAKAANDMPVGNRAELTRWRNEAHRVIGELLDAG